MKKIILSILLLLPITITAKENPVVIPMPVVCDKQESVLSMLKDFNEKLTFVGVEDDTKNSISVWRNTDSGSFTVVVTPKNLGYSCIVSAGSSSKVPEII